MNEVRGLGRAMFAAVLLTVGGVLNIIYGIAAIGNSKFFVHDTHYVFASLKSWGWITLIIGILELAAALSLFQGGTYGRYFAIVVGCTRGHRRVAGHPRIPILVARCVRAEPVDHPRADDRRRTQRHLGRSAVGWPDDEPAGSPTPDVEGHPALLPHDAGAAEYGQDAANNQKQARQHHRPAALQPRSAALEPSVGALAAERDDHDDREQRQHEGNVVENEQPNLLRDARARADDPRDHREIRGGGRQLDRCDRGSRDERGTAAAAAPREARGGRASAVRSTEPPRRSAEQRRRPVRSRASRFPGDAAPARAAAGRARS